MDRKETGMELGCLLESTVNHGGNKDGKSENEQDP